MHTPNALLDKGWHFRTPDGDPAVPVFPCRKLGEVSGAKSRLFYLVDWKWCFWLGIDRGSEIMFSPFEYDMGLDLVYNFNVASCFELGAELDMIEAMV